MKHFCLTFIAIFSLLCTLYAQIKEKKLHEETLSPQEILKLNYTLFNFKKNNIEFKNTDKTIIATTELFNVSFNKANYIINKHLSFEHNNTLYADCELYEYNTEIMIDSITKEVYHELGVVSKGKTIIKYQLKDLYSNNAFYRESSVILVADNDVNSRVTIYPNPIIDYFTLSFKDVVFTLNNIKIYNILGDDVTNNCKLTTENNDVKVMFNKNVTPGIYMVHIENEHYMVAKKIVKN
jgi:hypothetical protein